MWKSELKHQYWVAKKTVQRKLGGKEDENIILSDAALDDKISLFKFTSETTTELHKLISQFEERMRALSEEECLFGQFLKEAGKHNKTSGEAMIATGKAITFSGQQRMKVRLPLSRMHQEVEVFCNRAINDCSATIKAMEKERTEYRANLSWMKSLSPTLDPDTGMGLLNFRVAQSHVRTSKEKFDKSSADVIGKIDLLTAARYNMYSRTLLPYMTEMLKFSKICANTFKSVTFNIRVDQSYEFCVLKQLSQKKTVVSSKENGPITEVNMDQASVFADKYEDEETQLPQQASKNENAFNSKAVCKSIELLDIETSDKPDDFDLWKDFLKSCMKGLDDGRQKIVEKLELNVTTTGDGNADLSETTIEDSKKGIHSWTDLFAEFDPLDNLQAFGLEVAHDNTANA